MALKRTTVWLDKSTYADLIERYPELTFSEIMRLSLDYLREKNPLLTNKTRKFEGG